MFFVNQNQKERPPKAGSGYAVTEERPQRDREAGSVAGSVGKHKGAGNGAGHTEFERSENQVGLCVLIATSEARGV